MGVGEIDVLEDGKGSQVSCSVCLDPVIDNGDRSWAKLQCGHQFHLDCIGSAFNIKGAMQCPNCRKVEKGQWLFASPARSFPDVVDDLAYDDLYDITISEMAYGVHFCPFNGLAQMPLSYDEAEYSTAAYHDLVGQHSMFEPPAAASSANHPCPYIDYMGPVHPSSSSSSSGGSVHQDGGSSYITNNNHWNGSSEVTAAYAPAFTAMEVHYHSWADHLPPYSSSSTTRGVGSGDQPSIPSMTHRQARLNSDVSRSGNFMQHRFPMGHSSASSRTGSSVTQPSMMPPHPGSVARTRDRVQALQAYFQQPSNSRTPVNSGSRRSSSSHRGYSQAGPANSSSDQTSGFYYYPSASSGGGRTALETESNHHLWEREYQNLNPFSQVEREIWGPPPPRRQSDRMQSQNR